MRTYRGVTKDIVVASSPCAHYPCAPSRVDMCQEQAVGCLAWRKYIDTNRGKFKPDDIGEWCKEHGNKRRCKNKRLNCHKTCYLTGRV